MNLEMRSQLCPGFLLKASVTCERLFERGLNSRMDFVSFWEWAARRSCALVCLTGVWIFLAQLFPLKDLLTRLVFLKDRKSIYAC